MIRLVPGCCWGPEPPVQFYLTRRLPVSFRALMRIVMLKSGDGTTKPKPILLLRVSLCLKNHSGVSLARIVICSEHKTSFLFLLRDIATHLRLLSILFLRSPLYLCLGKTEFGVRFLVPAARESG